MKLILHYMKRYKVLVALNTLSVFGFALVELGIPTLVSNMIDEGVLRQDRSYLFQRNTTLNRALKRIASICGIEKRLVFHCGRHTYATEITLSQGVPLETVSKMLGHTRIDTTQIYAKVTDDKIGADTQNLDKKLAERFSIAL